MVKFKDFDEALQADKNNILQIKVAGKEYELPATLPARTVLTQMRFAGESEGYSSNGCTSRMDCFFSRSREL